jgi:phage protein U
MLMKLGSVKFKVWPLTATETSAERGGEYAEKPVVGRRPPLEFVGEAGETMTITARLLPGRLGGLGRLKRLSSMRQSGRAFYLMRGDGVPLGWMVIERVAEKSTWLDAKGVGQVIDVEITLRRASAPGPANLFASVMGMLG